MKTTVNLGDIWKLVNPAIQDAIGIYMVIEANINTEAGSDSWKAQRINPGTGRYPYGKVLYMHHDPRIQGEWEFVSRGVPNRANTPAEKQELMGVLLETWIKNPTLRLGQLMYIASYPRDIFNIEDKELLEKLKQFGDRPEST